MAFGFKMKISKAAYQKALAKVQRENRTFKKGRGGYRFKSAKAKTYATNRDRAVIEMYRLQSRKKAAPIVGYKNGDKITNWTGLKICTIRQRIGNGITAECIDGRFYVGRVNGEGMYVRLRPKKSRR